MSVIFEGIPSFHMEQEVKAWMFLNKEYTYTHCSDTVWKDEELYLLGGESIREGLYLFHHSYIVSEYVKSIMLSIKVYKTDVTLSDVEAWAKLVNAHEHSVKLFIHNGIGEATYKEGHTDLSLATLNKLYVSLFEQIKVKKLIVETIDWSVRK